MDARILRPTKQSLTKKTSSKGEGVKYNNSDAVITKFVNTLETLVGQDQHTHDTSFVNGAIWMRERIIESLNTPK